MLNLVDFIDDNPMAGLPVVLFACTIVIIATAYLMERLKTFTSRRIRRECCELERLLKQ